MVELSLIIHSKGYSWMVDFETNNFFCLPTICELSLLYIESSISLIIMLNTSFDSMDQSLRRLIGFFIIDRIVLFLFDIIFINCFESESDFVFCFKSNESDPK